MSGNDKNSVSTVSVIMPCYNHGRFVAESARSILGQTHKELELIIVDDFSADDSRQVLTTLAGQDQRIKLVLHEKNQGASKSRNDGLAVARGDFICFCDADDLWMPEKLSVQLETLERNRQYDVAYCDARIIDEHGAATGRRFSGMFPPPKNPTGQLFSQLCLRNFINMQTVMLRRKCLQPGANFDGNIKWVEDWWYWIQLSKKHLFVYSEQPLAEYRVHSRSTNLTQRQGYHINRFKVFHRALKGYPDISPEVRSQIWYHMAVCLLHLHKPGLGRRFLIQALKISLQDWSAIPQGVRPLARLLLGAARTGRQS
jgi:glycosyltransferase involved in cell wall biosynthesis